MVTIIIYNSFDFCIKKPKLRPFTTYKLTFFCNAIDLLNILYVRIFDSLLPFQTSYITSPTYSVELSVFDLMFFKNEK